MKPLNYTKRFYRLWQNPEDLVGFQVKYRETDLTIFAKKNLKGISQRFLKECRKPIEKTIQEYPEFKDSLKPLKIKSKYKIINKMIEISDEAGIGPMAGVAGAIAECVGKRLINYSEEVIIENGGDIWIKSSKDRILMVYAGEHSPFKDKIKIKIRSKNTPCSICTSSKSIGHSLNFGQTDATVVIAKSAIVADIFATAISNTVKSKKDLEKSIEYCLTLDRLIGGLILIDDMAAAWGEIELV